MLNDGPMHRPIRPAREGHSEHSYLTVWRESVASDEDMLEQIFGCMPYGLDLRGSQVAASFVTWLGTTVGQDLIRNAAQLMRDSGMTSRDAFHIAWAFKNRRQYSLNSNIRTVEFLLSDGDLLSGLNTTPAQNKAYRQLNITLRDLDVIDAVIDWLAEKQGQRFLDAAAARATADYQARCMKDEK